MEMIENYIYLASPYSHPDPQVREERFQEVNKAAAVLMQRGWVVYSPISHSHPIALAHDLPRGWTFWGRMDKAFIKHALLVAVLMLPGWRESVGIKAEMAIAREFNIPVVFLTPSTMNWSISLPRGR